MQTATTTSVAMGDSTRRTFSPSVPAYVASNAQILNSLKASATVESSTTAIPPSTMTSRWTMPAAWPKRNLSSPAWLAAPVCWMRVRRTMPAAKKTDSVTARAVSSLMRVCFTEMSIVRMASQPVNMAPSSSSAGCLL